MHFLFIPFNRKCQLYSIFAFIVFCLFLLQQRDVKQEKLLTFQLKMNKTSLKFEIQIYRQYQRDIFTDDTLNELRPYTDEVYEVLAEQLGMSNSTVYADVIKNIEQILAATNDADEEMNGPSDCRILNGECGSIEPPNDLPDINTQLKQEHRNCFGDDVLAMIKQLKYGLYKGIIGGLDIQPFGVIYALPEQHQWYEEQANGGRVEIGKCGKGMSRRVP